MDVKNFDNPEQAFKRIAGLSDIVSERHVEGRPRIGSEQFEDAIWSASLEGPGGLPWGVVVRDFLEYVGVDPDEDQYTAYREVPEKSGDAIVHILVSRKKGNGGRFLGKRETLLALAALSSLRSKYPVN